MHRSTQPIDYEPHLGEGETHLHLHCACPHSLSVSVVGRPKDRTIRRLNAGADNGDV
jgi:hypothetical protein